MSAFCVFGISKSICKKQADKKQEEFEVRGAGPSRPGERYYFSVLEWGAKRNELAEKIFTESEKISQISPKFDSPQFCFDWINSAKSEVRNCVIMCRMPKVDKNGGPIIKGGIPVMGWHEYDSSKVSGFGPLSEAP